MNACRNKPKLKGHAEGGEEFYRYTTQPSKRIILADYGVLQLTNVLKRGKEVLIVTVL